jgi:nitrate reductase gamma subunit
MITMGTIMIIAAYGVYAAFWIRFIAHFWVWWKAVRRLAGPQPAMPSSRARACAETAGDVFLFRRLLTVNPVLWFGEWVFHVSFILVLVRHLRYFLEPVPKWVWGAQTPGIIAGYVLPLSLAYILAVRLLTKREKYSSPANLLLLSLVLAISCLGVLMHALYKPDLVDVKYFAEGLAAFRPAAFPESVLFLAHFSLVLVLVPFLPTHIFTAPLVMMEARKREQALKLVMHEKEKRY